jgi:hypothetical protein
MNRNFSMLKRFALTAALVAGVSDIARADDSSMNPFTGDSSAYFNGGYDRRQISNPNFDKTPSAWRQNNPNGLSERVFQSYSAPGEAWHLNKPVFASAGGDPTFRQSHPNGPTERELQALSSEASAWHQLNQPATSGFLSSAETAQAGVREATNTGRPTLAQRMASLLHRLNKGASQSNP